MKTVYRHKLSGPTTTDVIISKNLIDGIDDLYSFRYDGEETYRTVTKKKFFEDFEEGLMTTDGYFITHNMSVFISSVHIQSCSKRIVFFINRATIDKYNQDANFFCLKTNAIAFFDDVLKMFPDFVVTYKDSGD